MDKMSTKEKEEIECINIVLQILIEEYYKMHPEKGANVMGKISESMINLPEDEQGMLRVQDNTNAALMATVSRENYHYGFNDGVKFIIEVMVGRLSA